MADGSWAIRCLCAQSPSCDIDSRIDLDEVPGTPGTSGTPGSFAVPGTPGTRDMAESPYQYISELK